LYQQEQISSSAMRLYNSQSCTPVATFVTGRKSPPKSYIPKEAYTRRASDSTTEDNSIYGHSFLYTGKTVKMRPKSSNSSPVGVKKQHYKASPKSFSYTTGTTASSVSVCDENIQTRVCSSEPFHFDIDLVKNLNPVENDDVPWDEEISRSSSSTLTSLISSKPSFSHERVRPSNPMISRSPFLTLSMSSEDFPWRSSEVSSVMLPSPCRVSRQHLTVADRSSSVWQNSSCQTPRHYNHHPIALSELECNDVRELPENLDFVEESKSRNNSNEKNSKDLNDGEVFTTDLSDFLTDTWIDFSFNSTESPFTSFIPIDPPSQPPSIAIEIKHPKAERDQMVLDKSNPFMKRLSQRLKKDGKTSFESLNLQRTSTNIPLQDRKIQREQNHHHISHITPPLKDKSDAHEVSDALLLVPSKIANPTLKAVSAFQPPVSKNIAKPLLGDLLQAKFHENHNSNELKLKRSHTEFFEYDTESESQSNNASDHDRDVLGPSTTLGIMFPAPTRDTAKFSKTFALKSSSASMEHVNGNNKIAKSAEHESVINRRKAYTNTTSKMPLDDVKRFHLNWDLHSNVRPNTIWALTLDETCWINNIQIDDSVSLGLFTAKNKQSSDDQRVAGKNKNVFYEVTSSKRVNQGEVIFAQGTYSLKDISRAVETMDISIFTADQIRDLVNLIATLEEQTVIRKHTAKPNYVYTNEWDELIAELQKLATPKKHLGAMLFMKTSLVTFDELRSSKYRVMLIFE
jgi:hypothetical protein